MPRVELSATFVRQFRKMEREDKKRVRTALDALKEDPRTRRPGADIRALKGTDPPKHRIRVGRWRVVYAIESGRVRVIETFRRGRGYR